MCEDVPRCENIKKDVRKLSDIWFPEHFKVYNAYWNSLKTVKHLALSPNGKDNNSTSDKSKTKKSFVVSFRSPEVAGTATSRDRLLQQGSGADRAHVLCRPRRVIEKRQGPPQPGRPFFVLDADPPWGATTLARLPSADATGRWGHRPLPAVSLV